MIRDTFPSTCLEMALWLESQGCSVFPLEPRSKKPLASVLPNHSWKEFQTRRATPEEIRLWFDQVPDANLALVCGSISGVVVIDVDGEKGQEWFKAHVLVRPNVFQFTSSPHKFHAFYKHPGPDIRVSPSVAVVEEIDVRGDGSYVVIAPSIHPTGVRYSLRAGSGFTGFDKLIPVPDIKLNRDDSKDTTPTVAPDADVEAGARNSSLTSVCGRMYAKGLSVEEVVTYAHAWNLQHCKPPLSEREVDTIARSMSRTHGANNPEALNTGGVENWVRAASGEFSVADLYRDLNVKLAGDKEKVRASLRELDRLGIIEKCGSKTGSYRKKEKQLDVIDLDTVQPGPVQMWLPMQLHYFCDIRPGNIIIVAGETNSGKTGFLFNLMSMNRQHHWNYLSSEMTADEIKQRIAPFGTVEDWKGFSRFVQRSGNYHDAIEPDGMNIVDFLEVYEDFSKVGSYIKQIFDRLRHGVAFIALQKKKGELFGRGGEFTLEKARLGISLFTHGRLPNGIFGSAKVTKCKNYKPGFNPEGKEAFYKLLQGYYYDTSPEGTIPLFNGRLRFWDESKRKKIITDIEAHCQRIDDEQNGIGPVNYYEG